MRWGLMMALAAALTACSSGTLTQIVVVVRSNIAIPTRMDSIEVDVSGTATGTESSTAQLSGAGAVSLPAILTLVYRGGPLGPIDVIAHARHQGAGVVQTEAQVSFQTGKILELDLDLADSCIGMTCAGATCGASGCRAIPIGMLPEWHGPPSDMDASLPDAATMIDASMTPDAGRDGGTDAGHDGGTDSGAASCTMLYGTAAGFRLCTEQATSCEMSVTLNNANCLEFCAGFGAVCLDAFDNNAPAYCTHVTRDGCLARRTDNICICSR